MSNPFVISMVFKADAAPAKAALTDVSTGLRSLSAEAGKSAGQTSVQTAELERLAGAAGKVSAASDKAAAAEKRRQKAQFEVIHGTGGTRGANSWITANLAAQGNDIVMMAMAGQNPLQLALQQGTQVAQVLNGLEKGTSITRTLAAGFMSMVNPVSLVTMGVIALGAVGLQALSGLIPKTKSLSEATADLSASVDRYKSALDQLRSADLSGTFGSSTAAARELLAELVEIERRTLALNAKAGMEAISDSLKDGWKSAFDFGAAPTFMKTFGVNRWDGAGIEKAAAVQGAARSAVKADGIDEQIAALQKLSDLWTVAADHAGGVTKEENEQARLINETLRDLIKARALQENAAGTQAARALTADLVRQAALQETIARYGENSAEARAAELGQLKAATAEKLAALGFDTRSVQFRQAMRAIDDRARARDDAAANQLTRAQEEKLSGILLERQLLGATAEERAHLVAQAEAEKTIRAEQLTGAAALLEIDRARVRAEEQIGIERIKAARQRQLDATTDALDAQIGLARDPLTRATLEAQREYARVLHETNSAKDAGAAADRVRARALAEIVGTNRTQIAALLDEVRVRQDVAAQVANGTLRASEANRVIRQELELRPLVAAAARAEGREKQQLTEIITGLRIAYEAQAAEDRRQAQNDYLRSGAERLQQARLELALVGQSAELRARVLALVQAERDIRQLGLTGEAAAQARRDADALGAINRQIERQADAWKTVQGAGEAAIDAVLDKLRGGDIAGAFSGLLDELNKGFFELGVANPLKNLILGTNLGTLQDVGGLGGIWDRLTGKARVDEGALIKQASSQVQAMQVAAAQVTINASAISLGGDIAQLLGGLPSAANSPLAPTAAGALNLSADRKAVAAQVWDFFTGKGLAPHQVAGIMGNISAESGFVPTRKQVGGNAIGLFQHDDRRFDLLRYIGGAGNLGDVQKQLQFAWHEMQTNPLEMRALANLRRSTNVREATGAFLGFERPQGFSWANPETSHNWSGRLQAAEQAMTTFAASAQTSRVQLDQFGAGMGKAGANMGQLSQGMGQFGGALGQILSGVAGSVGGKAGGILSTIIGAVGAMGQGVPLFARGGFTGAGNPDQAAGIVHAGEYVFDAAATRRIGVANLERMRAGTMRGFRSGGFVGTAPSAAPANSGAAPADASAGTFIANFDLRGAQDPAAVEAAARRGMRAALAEYRSTGLGHDVRRIVGKPRDR